MREKREFAARRQRFDSRSLRARSWGWRLFFPLAAGYAALLVPLSLQALIGSPPWLHALSSPTAHARELLGGFTLAVVCGYLLGIAPRWLGLGLAVLWLAARCAWLLQPDSLLAIGLQALFGVSMLLTIVPKFVGKGRKWRNLSMAPLLTLLTLAPTIVDLTNPLARGALLPAWVLLYAWLLAFMGGRLIAPAAAGAFESQGEIMTARVQPAIEAGIIISLAMGIALSITTSLRPVASALLILAGLLIALRLYRWRLWRVTGRIDLWCLGGAYAWLAAGCALIGATLDQPAAITGSVHAVTIGAIGVMTLNVMLRTCLLRSGQRRVAHPLFAMGTLLLSASAVLRIVAAWWPSPATVQLLWMAAAAWSVAFAQLLLTLLKRGSPGLRTPS